MDAAHIHLMLNHVPVLGAVFGLLVLGYGLARSSEDVIRTGLWTLVVVAVASGIVYLTGEPAEELVEGLAGFSEPILERHETAALWATVGAALVGIVSAVGLVLYRARETSRRFAAVVLVLTLGLTGLMGWTANLGGQVRHNEIRPDGGTSGTAGEAGDHRPAGEDAEHDEDGPAGPPAAPRSVRSTMWNTGKRPRVQVSDYLTPVRMPTTLVRKAGDRCTDAIDPSCRPWRPSWS